MDLAQQPEAEPMAAGKENAGPLEPARMPEPSPRTMMRRRNLAVGQETITAGPGAKAYTRVVVPKTGDELALIYNAFADKPLFAKLDSEQLTQVASIMTKAVFKQGDPLMAEGEQGDTFFILRSGSCSVTMGRRQVRTLEAGDGFGEIALIYNQVCCLTSHRNCALWHRSDGQRVLRKCLQPRTATITATADCTVFLMNRLAYRNEVRPRSASRVDFCAASAARGESQSD
jgi:hypothetical protein